MQFNTKKDLREKVKTLLRNQEEEKRLEKSLLIKDKLFNMAVFKDAANILFYASFDGEVDTFEMITSSIKLGKTIGLPAIKKGGVQFSPRIIHNFESDLEQGPYGIRQPKINPENEMKEIDLVIVPGVVFDKNNHRIGRGAGFYDRFLISLSEDVYTLGLAFDFQVIERLPHPDQHDVALKHVLTN
ncbi:MAG: 5-formyltetrahydrofolate cyclo-ligase [Candidatus Omnitrophica bacterium]|nr:5-formyltetrahydrofolate cyclo-ligase [Candidatus Omnitrophota bacterium]